MKKYYTILLCITTVLFVSCEKLLDKEPVDKLSIEDLFKDVSGAKTALAGAYKALLSENHYQRNLMVYPDILGGNIKLSKTTNIRLDDIYNAVQNPQESTMNDTYASLYSELNNINNVIKYTETAAGSSLDKEKIIAEAKCLRALVHFDLVRIFARPYNFTSAASHPGISLILKPQLFADPSPSRATVAQTYQAIIDDLQSAITVFDTNNNGILSGGYKQNYFTKLSAQALLSKVYLNQQNWNEAFRLSDEVIRSGQYALISNANYVNSWTGRVPSTESVLEIPIELTATGNSLGSYYDINNTAYRMFAATNDILGLYSENDVRRTSSMFNSVAISNVTYYFTKKYAVGGASATPLKLLRLSELYLIRAEVAAEKTVPDMTLANADLNLIRTRADATVPALNIAQKAGLIDAILLERRKELAFEGNLLFDLLRRKKDVVRVDVTAIIRNLNTDHEKLIMPLPEATVNANKNMIQNPGY